MKLMREEEGSQTNSIRNDVEHGYNQKKRRHSTYVEGKSKLEESTEAAAAAAVAASAVAATTAAAAAAAA